MIITVLRRQRYTNCSPLCSFIIALDDYHRIKETAVHDLLAAMLEHPALTMHLVIIGRVDPPMPVSRLRARSQVTELRTQDLRFTPVEKKIFLEKLLETQVDSSTAAAVEAKTEGRVTGLRLAVISMRHQGKLDPRLLEPHVNAQYVMEYLFTEVLDRQPPEIRHYLMGAAILDRFCGPLCDAVCSPRNELPDCEMGGWAFIDWLKKENIFLIALDAENWWFRFHHLFQTLLRRQLKRSVSPETINALHAKACGWFAENGFLEEALKHAIAAGDAKTAGSLVAEFGRQLMNDQQWIRLERCMYQLSRNQIEGDPALLVLTAWLHIARQNYAEVAASIKKIETLTSTVPPEDLINLKYVPVHLDALKWNVHFIASEGQNALSCGQRALKQLPLDHKRARVLADVYQLGAYMMAGKLDTGLRIYQQAMERHINTDKGYHANYLASLGYVYWMDANLIALRQNAETILNVPKEHLHAGTISYDLYVILFRTRRLQTNPAICLRRNQGMVEGKGNSPIRICRSLPLVEIVPDVLSIQFLNPHPTQANKNDLEWVLQH
jgi:LuxR family maltose regulon positive regulatory protein